MILMRMTAVPFAPFPRPSREGGWDPGVGTDWAAYGRERAGMSAFALMDGVVYQTRSAYARGLDGLWGVYQRSATPSSAASAS